MLNCRELIWGQASDKRVTSARAYSHRSRSRRTLRARARVHANEFSICCYGTDKKDVGVLRPPTASLLPHCRPTEIRRFRLKGSLPEDYITLRGNGRTKTRIRYSLRLLAIRYLSFVSQRQLRNLL